MRKHKLFIALTREPEIFGVNYTMLILLCFLSLITFLGTGNLFAILIGVPFYPILRYVNKRDPDLINILLKKSKHCPPVKNQAYWKGCNTYDPHINNESEK